MEALRDKNGLLESEYLAAYACQQWPRPSVTADIVLLASAPAQCTDAVDYSDQALPALEVLLIRRAGHPFIGKWALPGGFAEPGESLDETAARELQEETGLAGIPLQQLRTFSKPGRDPRGWTVTGAYLAWLEDTHLRPQAGDDAAEAAWFSVHLASDAVGQPVRLELQGQSGQLTATWLGGASPQSDLAFDHAEIIACAIKCLAGMKTRQV